MYIDYTPEQVSLQNDIRAYVAALMDDDLRAELSAREAGGPRYKAALRRMGGDGWLCLGWPTEWGGRGLGPMEQFIFFDEVHRVGFPIPLLTINTVGPTLMKYGTPAQKSEFLPRIVRGELEFSIGYTEPSAGTDLASLTTRAVRDGDDYVITGQKVFCSLAEYTDYLWLACRTNTEVAKHEGISVLIVPMRAPGVSITPIENLGDASLSAVYLDDVRVPATSVVGRLDGGWRLITSQLNHERVALMMVGPLARHLREVTAWAAAHEAEEGIRVLDLPWVRASLAHLDARIEVLRLLNWRQAWNLAHGQLQMHEASTLKVYGSELYVEAYRLLNEVLGAAGALRADSPGVLLRGELERYSRAMLVLTFGGGVNEVQRDIISAAALGLPRARR